MPTVVVGETTGGGVGPQGPKGDTGATGATGPQGPQGNPGAAGAAGSVGATGAAGAKGDKGDTGDQGPAGASEGVTLTSLGAVLDCDLTTGAKIGGGTATDNTSLINAALALATAANPVHLIVDGPSLISAPLTIPAAGHVTLEGKGYDAGFFVAPGSNAIAIQSAHTLTGVGDWYAQTYTNNSLPARGNNVSIRNMTINGNRAANSTDSFDRRHGANGQWLFGIWVMNLDHVLLADLQIINVPTFAVTIDNCGDVECRNIRVYDSGHNVNCDGIHIDGPANDIRISDCFFDNLGDDPIAVNAPEGFSGDISRVAVTNCLFNGTLTMARVYAIISTTKRGKVDHVSFTNCVGSTVDIQATFGTVLRLGNGQSGSTAVDWIRHVTLTNCRFSGGGFIDFMGDPCGDIELNDCTWISGNGSGTNNLVIFEAGTVIQNLVINGLQVYRETGQDIVLVGLSHSSTIRRLALQNIRVTGKTGTSFSDIAALVDVPSGSSVPALRLDGIDMTGVAALVGSNGFGNITKISGDACAGSGFQIPDANMADGVVYLSSDDSGVPSIKVSGVAKRFTIS